LKILESSSLNSKPIYKNGLAFANANLELKVMLMGSLEAFKAWL